MATLNLGRIKPVFRGAYAGGTAYVVDDIVTSGGETFICILASTGNATSNATYWTKLAQKGTDGTDVGATLTTQGDILYRDGSGLQRLAIGTANQQLRINSGATAPEWATITAGGVVQTKFYNFSGTLSATIPAPACTYISLFLTIAVLNVIQVSISPFAEKYPTHPAYISLESGSNSLIISIALIFGAPDTVPAGKPDIKISTKFFVLLAIPTTLETMCIT